MIRQYLVAICIVGLMNGVASAEDLKEEKPVLTLPASDSAVGTRRATACDNRGPCTSGKEDAKARMAMALLYLGISKNCGQRPCAMRLAASRQ